MEGLRVYRGLLKNRPLTRLLLGEFVSGIGDWLYIVAIFVVIYEDSQDAALVGLFGAVRLLPYVFLSVPAGFIADRFERRLVLLVGDLVRGTIMVILGILVSVHASTVLIAAFAILAACGSTFFYPAMGAYLPSLVEDERQLGPANSAWASLGNISFILGPAIGGLLLVTGNLTLPFIINALSFVFIAVILWKLPHSKGKAAAPAPAPLEAAGDGADAGVAASAGEAAADVPVPATSRLKLKPLAGLTLVQLMAGFIGGGFQVITVILAVDVLNAGQAGNGYLNAAIGIGGLIGGIGAGSLVLKRNLGVPLFVGAAIMAGGTFALGLTTSLPVALAAIGISSAGALVLDVVLTTIFQRLVPNELMGRAVGIIMAVSTLTGAAGAFVLPVLLQETGPFASMTGVAVATVIFSVIGILIIGTAAVREPTPYEAVIERIAKLDLFTGVPRSRLEAAMHKLKEVPVVAGQAVVTQGETADRFYIIEKGTYTVTQVQAPGAEPVVLRKLGEEQVFGEIGLLRSSPRTATVTADADGVVLALQGKDFLRLVGASGELQGRLLGLYAGGGGGSR